MVGTSVIGFNRILKPFRSDSRVKSDVVLIAPMRGRAAVGSVDVVRGVADAACSMLILVYDIEDLGSRTVPHGGFAAVQDDIGLRFGMLGRMRLVLR